jgi:riboflavin synthase alpha subunit
MFTGIVEEIGKVRAASPGGLTVYAYKVLGDTKLGDSIAVNGVCLTVTALSTDSFSADVMPETLRRTNLGTMHPGDEVNLIWSVHWRWVAVLVGTLFRGISMAWADCARWRRRGRLFS